MLGRNRARRLWLTLSVKDRRRYFGDSAFGCALALVLAASVSQCGFPDYGFPTPTPEQGGSAGSSGGTSGDSGTPDIAGAGGTPLGGEGGGASGAAGEGGEGGAGGEPSCVYPEPLVWPDHCFDKLLSAGETGVDCGGSECPSCTRQEACAANRDCASALCSAAKTCSPVLIMHYASIDYAKSTRAPKFKLVINYLSPQPTALAELRIRYYFHHNGVTEPVIGIDSQATLDPGESQRDISTTVSALVYRQLPGPLDHKGHRTDSYLEITFNSPSFLSAGTELVVVQDIVAGSPEVTFEQETHYSFVNTNATLIENDGITVFRGAQRLWGVEPPLRTFPPCAFATGVNVGGEALRIRGEAISAERGDTLTFSAGQTSTDSAAKVLPATDVPTTRLLTTWHTLSSADTAVWSVPNGTYWAYAWLTSASGTTSGTLSLQGNPADKFFALQKAPAGGWGLLGPYAVDVSNETLTLSVAGTVNLAGLKLYRAPLTPF